MEDVYDGGEGRDGNYSDENIQKPLHRRRRKVVTTASTKNDEGPEVVTSA